MFKSHLTCPNFMCKHSFSTRYGGMSQNQFNSLNLGFSYGDDEDLVTKNWEFFSDMSNISIENLVWTKQVHKNKVAIVTAEDAGNNIKSHMEGYDGLVTNKKDVTLCIFTADCAPLLLYDIKEKIIGAIHCGWKPICSDIVKNAIDAFKKLGSKIENITACVGPCIGPCCFEVGQEVVDAFTELLGKGSSEKIVHTNDKNKQTIDLQEAIKIRLVQLGIPSKKVNKIEECTSCNVDKYFSYRKQNGDCGRMASIISL